ncbi:MAG: LacI family DNA-binding transcriptional regulator [Pseudomonadota bacterium]
MNGLKTQEVVPTLRDVAKLAGVSTKTASRVANGERGVRASTQSRVQRAIDLLDYKANPYAIYLRSLRENASQTARHR